MSITKRSKPQKRGQQKQEIEPVPYERIRAWLGKTTTGAHHTYQRMFVALSYAVESEDREIATEIARATRGMMRTISRICVMAIGAKQVMVAKAMINPSLHFFFSLSREYGEGFMRFLARATREAGYTWPPMDAKTTAAEIEKGKQAAMRRTVVEALYNDDKLAAPLYQALREIQIQEKGGE